MQVEAREVARRVVDVHVLAAGVRRVDPRGVRRGVPVVDRRVELQAGVRALPRGPGDLAPEVSRAGPCAITVPSVRARQVPVAVLEHRLHELVRDAHRVVRVLVLDRVDVLPSRSMSKPASRSTRALRSSLRLAPDELLDVGVVDVEDDHLRGAARLAARLDRAGRRVGAAHEADTGPEAVPPPASSSWLARMLREVHARARAALEDRPLLGVPVEDRVHRVVDREDEARARLLRARP